MLVLRWTPSPFWKMSKGKHFFCGRLPLVKPLTWLWSVDWLMVVSIVPDLRVTPVKTFGFGLNPPLPFWKMSKRKQLSWKSSLGKPEGERICSYLDNVRIALTPPPFALCSWTPTRNFFYAEKSAEQKCSYWPRLSRKMPQMCLD